MRGEGFGIRAAAACIGILYLAAFVYIRITSGSELPEMRKNISVALYAECETAIEGTMPEDPRGRAFAKALFLGDKSEISREDKEYFRISGVSHLLALSGMHLSILYGIFTVLTSFIPSGRAGTAVRSTVNVSLLFIYSLMTGMANSIARAFVMIFIYETGKILGRKQKPLWVLALSAIIILSYNPEAAADVGFQLSYSAMIGIFTVFPYLKDLVYTKNRAMKYIWNTIALSVACQISTLPLILWYFGYFPKYFLVTNLLCVPLSSVILALIMASMLAFAIWPPAGIFCGKILSCSIDILVWITESVSALP